MLRGYPPPLSDVLELYLEALNAARVRVMVRMRVRVGVMMRVRVRRSLRV